MSHLRLLAVASLLGASALPAAADLEIPLGQAPAPAPKAAPPAVAKRAEAVRKKKAPPRLPSRGLRQVGVVRRGSGPPILPPADGTIPPEVGLPALPAPEPPPAVRVNARLGRMLAAADVYRLPDPRSQWVGRLKAETQVAIVSQWQGWFAIVMGDGSQAYVPQTHVEVLPFQVRTVTPVAPAPAPQSPVQPARRISFGEAVIQEAYRYLGVPYVWGGNDERGLDCSGLVKNCFARLGVKLPRRGGEQAEVGYDVPLDQLQPGDRLYFSVSRTNDHTGIYIGNGKFIHAGRGRGNVGIDSLDQPLYKRSLTSARRL